MVVIAARSIFFSLSGAGRNFSEPVHLIQIVGARPQDEFIDSHVGLTLDRLFHRRARGGQSGQAPRRKIGIVAVVGVDVAVRVIPSVRTERIIEIGRASCRERV